jgi:hypothetical protein
MELSAEELLEFTRSRPAPSSAPHVARTGEPAVSAPPPAKPVHRLWHSPLVLASIGSILLLATVATLRVGASEVSLEPELPLVTEQDIAGDADALPVPDAEPVRIRNPFDKSEVFEFPSGTSEQEAHDAVADMLLKRAIERQAEYDARRAKKRKAT